MRVYWIHDKLPGVKIILQCLLLYQLLSHTFFAYADQELENLAEIFKADQEIANDDRQVVQKLWNKYVSGKTLSVREDITVFEYENWINRKAKRTKSPFDNNYEAYRGLDKEGWKLFVNHRTKNGLLYEVLYLKPNQPTPYFKWSEKKIEMLLEIGTRPRRKIVSYSVDTGKLVEITDSLYDDYGAFYNPDENYIIFLSNRDRESLNDTKSSLYAVEISNISEVLRLTSQEDFLGSEYQQFNPVFSNENRLTMQLKNNLSKTYVFNTLIQEAKNRARKMKKMKDPVRIVRNSSNNLDDELLETKIDEYKIKQSTILLVKSTGKVYLKESFNESDNSDPLMSMSESVFKSFPGPITLPDSEYLFFIKLTNNIPGVWSYNATNRGVSQISPPREHCYGMQYEPSAQTLAYILKRNQLFYLIVENLKNREVLHRFKIPEPSMETNRSLIKILSSDKIYYLDKKGDWQLADDRESNETTQLSNTSALDEAPKPIFVFNAPFIPNINNFEEKTETIQVSSQENGGKSNIELITKEIEFIRNSIQWISSNQEHQRLMYRYNDLHQTISKEIDKMNNSDTNLELRLKARWIESLNGLKELLNNSKLLLEVE